MRTASSNRRGTVLPLVLAFAMLLFVTAGVSAFQTSGIRRIHSKSQLGFIALEVALSAIDEAAAELAAADTEKLFPASKFGGIDEFLAAVRDNKAPAGVGADKVDFRTITFRSGRTEKLLTGITFSDHSVAIPMDRSKTRRLFATRTALRLLSDVSATPLRFRREHYTASPRWVNWGVVQFRVAVEVGERGNSVLRIVTVDRLFKLRATRLEASTARSWKLEISGNSQRTVIRGTRRKGDPA